MHQTTGKPIWHTIIIGAGASGLMCAGSFPAEKLVLDHNAGPGRKLDITGGGKCNFTHQSITARDYICTQKHFPSAALAAYPPGKIIELLRSAHIMFSRQDNGCYFATRAREITQFLFHRAKQQHTTFSFNTQVLQVTREKEVFTIRTSKGIFYAYHLVLACGGLSYPALGASGLAWQAAHTLGLATYPPRPALVGFRLPKTIREEYAHLAGNSIFVTISLGKHTEEGPLLFTHEGISGPCVLQTSLYWQEGKEIVINFCPNTDIAQYLRAHKNTPAPFSKILSDLIPVKITKTLLGSLDVRATDAPRETLLAAAQRLNHFNLIPVSTAGYTHAEVTAGGIDPQELDSKTLQSKKISGLYCIGEAVDVTGRVGGYNLHWAWASGWAAAQSLLL